MRIQRALIATLALGLSVGACSGGDDDDADAPPAETNRNLVQVHTTTPLTEVVTGLVEAFRAEEPELEVELSIGEYPELQDALDEDEADVIVIDDGFFDTVDLDAEPQPFGRDLFVIVTAPGNPDDVEGLEIFGRDDALVAACGPDIGFGNLAAIFLENAGVEPADGVVDAECEEDVADRLAAGALTAGLMLRTGVGTRDDVEVVPVPGENPAITYSYAVVDDVRGAVRFRQFVESATGLAFRTQRGYLP